MLEAIVCTLFIIIFTQGVHLSRMERRVKDMENLIWEAQEDHDLT